MLDGHAGDDDAVELVVHPGAVRVGGCDVVDRHDRHRPLVRLRVVPAMGDGWANAAVAIFETIAVAMVSLATLVLVITMVVVQLAMGQFSPRIVQTFLRDRPSQLAIGLFVATFAHAMLALREVQADGDGQVPGLAIVVAYVLVLTSIAMLVLYVHHIGRSLRVSALIELVGSDIRDLLERSCPDRLVPDETCPDVIAAPHSGVLVGIDRQRLVELAAGADCVLHVVPGLGGFVPAGAALVRIEGDAEGLDRQAVTDALHSGLERTLDEDLAYGFRLLVDMAERSLADSEFLDPTTAVQCIDRLHDGLRQLSGRVIPDGLLRDEDGTLRVTFPTLDWDAYVHLAFDEIRLAGATSPQIARRLRAALDDLVDIAPAARRPPLLRQLALLENAVQHSSRQPPDIRFVLRPDSQGIGPAHRATGDLKPAARPSRHSPPPASRRPPISMSAMVRVREMSSQRGARRHGCRVRGCCPDQRGQPRGLRSGRSGGQC